MFMDLNNMDFKIVAEYQDFKETVINKNRYFNEEHPFLKRIESMIEKDTKENSPGNMIFTTFVEPGTILYRARIFEDYICNSVSNLIFTHSFLGINNEDFKEEKSKIFSEAHTKYSIQDSSPAFEGYSAADSFVPPPEKANYVSDMRANPKYIRYLYAAEDIYTAVVETRPPLNAVVSVAEIEVKEKLRMFNSAPYRRLRNPKGVNEDILDLCTALVLAFSTVSSGDLRDYLPAQVLSEYFKSIKYEYDGVIYKSSLTPAGLNYVIFNYEKCVPISSALYAVGQIDFTIYGLSRSAKTFLNLENHL